MSKDFKVLEKNVQSIESVNRVGQLILKRTKENLDREALLKTPERFSRALDTLLQGYHLTISEVIGEGIFPAESNGLVSVNDIEFYSMCEHHLLPFWGKVSVSYFPKQKIIGLSKIPRLVDFFARRIQVQERLTKQIGESLLEVLDARAVVVRCSAQHLCMMMRGVQKQNSQTKTEYVCGEQNLSRREIDSIFNLTKV